MEKVIKIELEQKMLVDLEKDLIDLSKRYASYKFHKRNKWLYYIPFYQMGYMWRMEFGPIWFKEIKSTISRIEKIEIFAKTKKTLT